MSASTVLTLGYGTFAGIKYIPTLGYNLGATPTPDAQVTGGGFIYHTPNQKRKKTEPVAEQVQQLVSRTNEAELLQRRLLAEERNNTKEVAALEAQLQQLQAEIIQAQQQIEQRQAIRRQQQAMLVLAMSSPFNTIII